AGAGAPMVVKIEKIDVAGGGKTILLDGGVVQLDPAARTWKLADATGHVQVDLADVVPTTTVANAATRRTQPAGNHVDRFQPAGRLDFTAAASGPLDLRGKNPWQAIRHEIIAYPRGMALRPRNFSRRIEDITGGEVRLVNAMIIF